MTPRCLSRWMAASLSLGHPAHCAVHTLCVGVGFTPGFSTHPPTHSQFIYPKTFRRALFYLGFVFPTCGLLLLLVFLFPAPPQAPPRSPFLRKFSLGIPLLFSFLIPPPPHTHTFFFLLLPSLPSYPPPPPPFLISSMGIPSVSLLSNPLTYSTFPPPYINHAILVAKF